MNHTTPDQADPQRPPSADVPAVAIAGTAAPTSRKTVWPLNTQCSRVEQRLLTGLRSLDPKDGNEEQGKRMLDSIGFDAGAIAAFVQLYAVLGVGQAPVRLLGPGASFVTVDELDLLACLNRMSRGTSLDARLSTEAEEGANPLLAALHNCALVLRAAGVVLRQRTLPHSGRRFIEHENVTSRQAASMALRPVTVRRIEQLTSHMRRITFGGADMPGYLDHRPGQWVKLFAPEGGQNGGQNGGRVGRAYTVRHYRPALHEFDIDCVLHDSGPMSRWAAAAEPGQQLEVSGARGGFPIDAELQWMLLAGDQAALPAIAAIMEALPASMTAKVVLEVRDYAEITALPTLAAAEVQFVAHRPGRRTAPGALLDLIRGTTLPDGPGQVWLAAEASVTRAVRNHLLIDRLIPAKRIHSVAYWKRGEQDHADLAAG